MQMGRWFGYRPNYDDLCRVWLTGEAQDWYTHVAEAIEELRSELAKMEQLGLRLRILDLRFVHIQPRLS